MSSNPSTKSAVHIEHDGGDARAAESRSLKGKTDGHFRIMDEVKGLSKDVLKQHVSDYYTRIQNEVKRGERSPVKLGKWKSVADNYQRFLLERIPHNLATFKKHNKKGGSSLSLIPASYSVPHPTDAEKEEYMSRWNDDGDLYLSALAECKKHTKDMILALMPTVVHAPHPKSPLMVCVLLITAPMDEMLCG